MENDPVEIMSDINIAYPLLRPVYTILVVLTFVSVEVPVESSIRTAHDTSGDDTLRPLAFTLAYTLNNPVRGKLIVERQQSLNVPFT